MEKTDLENAKEYLKNMTPEQEEAARQKTIAELKEKLGKKKLKLVKWKTSKDSLGWSHDHCEFCMAHISDKDPKNNEAYTDETGKDWVCKACYKAYLTV